MEFETKISTKISNYIVFRCLYICILKHVWESKKERFKVEQNKNDVRKTQKN